MEFDEIIENMTDEVYKNLKSGVETGKWANGQALTDDQKANSLQAIIAYEIKNNFPEEQRTGFVNTAASSCHNDDGSVRDDNIQTIKWK